MKKNYLVALLAIILVGCAYNTTWYRQDGIVPYKYFQTKKNDEERLVFISPVLGPDHRQSGLYIITNPDDVIKATNKLGDPSVIKPNDLKNTLNEFSPVNIWSSRDLPKEIRYSNYNRVFYNQDGIAGFSLPPSIEQIFYVYWKINDDYKFFSNDPTEVWIGTIPLPPGLQDIFITVSEEEGIIVIITEINPNTVKKAYDNTTGLYGTYLSKNKKQIGFIEVNGNVRVQILRAEDK